MNATKNQIKQTTIGVKFRFGFWFGVTPIVEGINGTAVSVFRATLLNILEFIYLK